MCYPEQPYDPPVDNETPNIPKSCDPNEMVGEYGVGDARYVKPGQELTYTIYFENKAGFDIADAQEVRVTNPLNEWLDWSTFEMGTVSVGGLIINGLDGATADEISAATDAGLPLASEVDQTNGLYKTRAEVQFDAASGVASWYIRVLDPAKRKAGELLTWPNDDTAGVLQPNVVSPEGEGYITYSVKVRDDAPALAVIDSSADIVFDANPVIVTDPAWWNTVYGGGAEFVENEIEVNEGETATIRVMGGNADVASSVKLYLTYNTAAAADVELGKAKFPLTLTWEAGEMGEKVVEIPVKADSVHEGDEMLTLQLAGAVGMELGEERVCTVVIRDADEAAPPAGAVEFEGGYYVVSKGNATAKALPGYVFVAWVYDADGRTYSTKATITEKVRKSKAVHPLFAPTYYQRALVDDPATGTVKGQGRYAAGKSVSLTATPKKGYAFTGWRDSDGGLVSLDPAYKYVAGEGGATLTASFKKEGELARPVLTLADSTGETSSGEASGNDRTLSVGVSYPATLSVAGESKVSITKVAGLPSGLKYKGGKITGVPTKAGGFTASVTVALASNKKKTWVCKVPFSVVALPEWAMGTFTGVAANGAGSADATMSVGSTGKISGKFAIGGTNWTFSASSFAADSVVTGEVVRFSASATAKGTWKEKSGKKTATKSVTVPLGFALAAAPGVSAIASATEGGYFGDDGGVEFARDAGVSVAVEGASGGGTVSLSAALGQAASGKAVKATAKPKKGYAFTGWRVVEGGETNLATLALSHSLTMDGTDVFLVASFKKEGDLAAPTLTWGGEVHPDVSATNLTAGVAYSAKLEVECEAAVKIAKVAGIPAGTSSFKDGVLALVPSKAGRYTVSVTVALSTNAKKTWVYKVPLSVAELPGYAKGSYSGAATSGDDVLGLAAVSVGAAGKISGKFYQGGTNWTLSAASYTGIDGDDYVCTNLLATYSWKSGKATMRAVRTFTLRVGESAVDGESEDSAVLGRAVAEELADEGVVVDAWQSLWGASYKSVGQKLFYTSKKNPSKTWASVAADGLGEHDVLSLKVDSSGAVTATYRLFLGTFDKNTKKPQYAAYTCATALVPTSPAEAEELSAFARVYFPPVAASGFPGFTADVAYPFKERDVPTPQAD